MRTMHHRDGSIYGQRCGENIGGLVTRLLLPVVMLLLTLPLAAQEFGKNKVQYRNFQWKFIQTANFDIYFYDEAGVNLAYFTADVAENALVSLQNNLRFRITERISLILYNSKNDFQQTNVVGAYMPEGVGGVTELFKNRVVVPFEGSWEAFRHVIHHELVHAVLNDKFYGGSVQSLLTNNIQVQVPIWMNEGLAEFESHDGYNAETDMFIRDAVIGQYMPELYQLNGYFSYRGGQAFYWYVEQNYGREKIGELLDRMKVSSSLDAAFMGAFGKNVKDFSEQFLYDLKKLYWPDIADRTRPRDFARVLTDHEEDGSFMNASPSISPDGSQVAFISDRKGPRSVFVMSVDKPENIRQLVQGERNVEFEELHLLSPAIAWSPDSRRVAMAVKSKGKDAIFLIDVASGDREKIDLDLDAIYSVNWSSDGLKLAFQGIKGDASDIYSYDLKRKELRNLTDDIFSDFDPKWSEDGETVYFLSDRRENAIREFKGRDFKVWNYNYDRVDIYALNVTTLELTQITNDDAVEKTPSPGPDGSLLYVSDVNGIYNVYVQELGDLEPRPITNSITGIEQLTVTPDGSKLVFSAWNGQGYDIFLMRSPFAKALAKEKLAKTTFFEKKEDELGEMIAEIAGEEEKPYTVVTDLNGYGDAAIDLDGAVAAEAPADRIRAKTFDAPVAPPPGSVTSTGDYVVQDYKVKFSTDIIQAGGGYTSFYGVQGLVQALFSDELGDHSIYVATDLQLDLVNSDFYFFYNYLAKRIDYEVGVFQNAVLLRIGDFGEVARFRQLGGSLTASNPFDRFRRLELGTTLMNVTRESLQGESTLANQSKFMVLPEVRYVFDNSESLIYNPVAGSRYAVSLLGSPKLGNGVGFYSMLGDFRHYIPLDKWGLTSVAMRFSGGASFGPDPQQFYIGGMDGLWLNYNFSNNGIPIANAEDYSLVTPGYPLRGYDYGQQTGSKYGLVNMEFRYPVLLFGSGGILPSLLQLLSGTVFVDAGTAWNNNLNLTNTTLEGKTVTDDLLLGTGLGFRSFVFGFPIRLDVAWQYNLQGWSRPKYYFSLGSDF